MLSVNHDTMCFVRQCSENTSSHFRFLIVVLDGVLDMDSLKYREYSLALESDYRELQVP